MSSSQWAEISPEQHQAITGVANDAMAPAGQLTGDYLKNIDFNSPRSLLRQSPEMYGANNNSSMLEAIQRKSDVKHSRDMQVLRNKAGMDAVEDKFMRLQSAAKLVSMENQHNEQVRAAKYAERMNRRAARAGVLGNVLGIGGAVVGGVATMSPMGAMAGYGIGQGVGQMAGQGGE